MMPYEPLEPIRFRGDLELLTFRVIFVLLHTKMAYNLKTILIQFYVVSADLIKVGVFV